ncbi:MAG: leucine-rich repeat protein [Anaeroplasmataceae bacterium]|nr:leucine-rich repeat protein [Anaeroplasmataceae bacterium]
MKKLFAILCIALIASFAFVSCTDSNQPQRNTYMVTFDSQGGSRVADQEVLEGNPIRRPETPERNGYFLNGWYLTSSPTADSEWHFDTDFVTKDITLYAGWTIENLQDPTEKLIFKQDGNAYTITGTTGEDTIIVIPSEYNGLPVTKIQGEFGTGAFARTAITKVTIPDSIIEIGQNSFNNCSSLQTVVISTQSNLTTIGNNAFLGNSSLTEMYIPIGMVNLGDSVFNNCGAIERFIVADGNSAYKSENGHLISKGNEMLIRGSNNQEIPNGVKSIGIAAFRRSIITELIIPDSVTEIGNYFISDSGIEKITYKGTAESWEQVEKANLWNFGKTDITIEFVPKIEQEEITKMYITINGNKLEVTLAENSSVGALVERLKQGDIIYTANDYGGFEKVGSLGFSLPTNDTQITTQSGDVILYLGNQIVLFYGSNSWSYTRLGRIIGYSASELRTLLGAGNGSSQVMISLK